MKPVNTELGRFVREHRLKRGKTQSELSKIIPPKGRSDTYIGSIERGTRRHFGNQEIEVLARELLVSISELTSLIPEHNPPPSRTALGKLICSRLKDLGLSTLDLARRAGISRSEADSLRGWSHYSVRGINYKTALKLATALDIALPTLAPFVGKTCKTATILGQIIRDARASRGMSGAKLAKMLSISRERVSQIELGKTSLRKSDVILSEIAHILGIDREVLRAAQSAQQSELKNRKRNRAK